MSQTIEIYLGKNSQTFGPYTIEQFDTLRASADFASYTYIWDGRDEKPDWRPIEKAPPMPARKAGPGAPPPDHHTNHGTEQPAPVAPARETPGHRAHEAPVAVAPTPSSARAILRGYDVPGIDALCHDSRHVITGKLTQVTDTGCELICPDTTVAPGFGSKSPVMINLLEPKTGRSMNVTARLGAVRRREGQWSLKVLWKGCPELIVEQLEKAA